MKIVEVGPRDGLQNETAEISTEVKAAFILALARAGLTEIEATSFVSPKWVPQLGDAADLWPLLPFGPNYSALVPNRRGFERAQSLGVRRIAVFTAASEEFTRRNINATIAESIAAFKAFVPEFLAAGGTVRGYVSTAFECPFAGRIAPPAVVEVANALIALGCDEISLGDTIGKASPSEVSALIRELDANFAGRRDQIAWHFHDTYGTAVANVSRALESGYETFDASAGGLGGCPYAPGAGGNLATEDLVYFLEREGVRTGVDLDLLASASVPILEILQRAPTSKTQRAVRARRAQGSAT